MSESRRAKAARALQKAYESPATKMLVPIGTAIVGAIVNPAAGVALSAGDAGVTALIGSHTSRQTEQLLAEYRLRLDSLEGENANIRSRLDRLEMRDAAAQVFIANAQDSPDKVPVYADLLAGFTALPVPWPIDFDAMLSIVSTLSRKTLALAIAMCAEVEKDPFKLTGLEPPPWGPDRDFHLKQLEMFGLVTPIIETFPGESRAHRYAVTPTLQRLVRLLEDGEAGQLSGAEL